MYVRANRPTSRFQLRLVWSRMIGVAKLDTEVIQMLSEDKRFTGQAIAVLVLVALSYGIGFTLFSGFTAGSLSLYESAVGSLATMIISCFAAFLWSITTFLVGTKLFKGKSGYWELARPFFFAATPGVLLILNSIPVPPLLTQGGTRSFPWFQAGVTAVSTVWLFLAQTFVLKQAMGFNTQRTLLTVGVSFLILVFLGLTITVR